MAKGINKAILVGRLGNEPVVTVIGGEKLVATISLATGFPVKDSQTGEWRDETDWHRVVFWNKLAEVVKQHLHKGSQIYVEGRLKTRKWQDKNTGQDRYVTEIIAREMQMLGEPSPPQQQPTPAPQQQPSNSSATHATQQGGNQYGGTGGGYSQPTNQPPNF